MSENTKAALSVAEVAATLGLSRPTAYRLVHQEGFPRLEVGRRIIVPRSAFLEWLDAQARKGAVL